MAEACLYDGEVALRRVVTVSGDGDQVSIAQDGGAVETIATGSLRCVAERGGERVYGRTDRPGWRLTLAASAAAQVAGLPPPGGSYGGWIDRLGLWRAAAVGIVGSALVMLVVWSLPRWLAPAVPDRWMQAYGDALVGDFGGRFCAGGAGQPVIDKLVARLAPGESGLKVRVVNFSVVNAAALPGGQIVVFRGLLNESRSPEEFAGVLAHEIAHVRNRDVAEAMIREMGFGFVVGAVGGNTGGYAHQLASLSYSRSTERRADADAIRMLRQAGISPAPTAGFFDRLAREEARVKMSGAFVYLSTHPVSKTRAAAFRRAARPAPSGPLLTRDEWDALRAICHNGPAQKPS